MNIFVLDVDPVQAARWQLDKHIVKMPLETAQMLSTNLHLHGFDAPYRPTHKDHPCTVWARRSRANFEWLVAHGLALCAEYTGRYGRIHKSQAVIVWADEHKMCIPAGLQTPFAQALPEEHKGPCAVAAYRSYYHAAKAHIATWKRNKPQWWSYKDDSPVCERL